MLTIRAYAKINLYLDVIERYPDGYHQIESVMQSVSLHDLVELAPSNDISISCTIEGLCGHDNLAFRAASLLRERAGAGEGAAITVVKNIPVAAGLAGGSADAAATLTGLNILWGLDLPLKQLQEIGLELGADVPFCLAGGTMLAEGRGEELTRLAPMPDVGIVLVTPPIHVSTAEIYRGIDEEQPYPFHAVDDFVRMLLIGDVRAVAGSMQNLLETVALTRYPAISRIKQMAREAGAAGTMMSGSGPTVFAVFGDADVAQWAAESIKRREPSFVVSVVRPVRCGVEVLSEGA